MLGKQGRLLSSGRKAQNLEKEIKQLQSNSIHKNLTKLQECLCKLYMNEFSWQAEIEKTFKSAGYEWSADQCKRRLDHLLRCHFTALSLKV